MAGICDMHRKDSLTLTPLPSIPPSLPSSLQTRADSYTDLLARAYGMAGICDMYGGDWEDAYDRLQKSAR